MLMRHARHMMLSTTKALPETSGKGRRDQQRRQQSKQSRGETTRTRMNVVPCSGLPSRIPMRSRSRGMRSLIFALSFPSQSGRNRNISRMRRRILFGAHPFPFCVPIKTSGPGPRLFTIFFCFFLFLIHFANFRYIEVEKN